MKSGDEMKSGGPLPWLVYPVLVGAGVGFVPLGTGLGLPLPIPQIVVQIVTVLLVIALERFMPEHGAWNVPKHDLRTDGVYFLISGFGVSALMRWVLFAKIPSFGVWPTHWPLGLQVFSAVFIADFGSYATHVAAHRMRWLWPIHAPHHSARRLYWLNATRMHPLDQTLTIVCSLTPLALLGTPADTLALFDAFAIVHLTLQHSNIRLRHGLLSQVVATAEFHRWHHSTERAESERNYASFLSLWDRMFRTFAMPSNRQAPADVGLYADTPRIHDDIREQLASPFRAWRTPRRE
jgi:sterol desaturase/sphingolipid hydroxylase (fatty acid hydroxylase superfamily)